MLNDDKAEAICFAAFSSSTQPNFPQDIRLGTSTIDFSASVQNHGFILDKDLTLKNHVIKACHIAYAEIRHISSIRHCLTYDAKTLVTSLVLSRLDYCNSLLSGYPQSLIQL